MSEIGVQLTSDRGLADQLSRLINDVYDSGLWRDGFERTSPAEIVQLIAAGQIAIATRNARVVGGIRIHDAAPDASEFGLLVAAPDQRGIGVGRALVDFAERRTRERGLRAIRLELLVPLYWSHPTKEFLKGWYARRGYRLIGARSVEEAYPHLAPLLATRCALSVYEKPLQPARGEPGSPRGSRG
jgi:GNAT superfamily N-acetyltransferase